MKTADTQDKMEDDLVNVTFIGCGGCGGRLLVELKRRIQQCKNSKIKPQYYYVDTSVYALKNVEEKDKEINTTEISAPGSAPGVYRDPEFVYYTYSDNPNMVEAALGSIMPQDTQKKEIAIILRGEGGGTGAGIGGVFLPRVLSDKKFSPIYSITILPNPISTLDALPEIRAAVCARRIRTDMHTKRTNDTLIEPDLEIPIDNGTVEEMYLAEIPEEKDKSLGSQHSNIYTALNQKIIEIVCIILSALTFGSFRRGPTLFHRVIGSSVCFPYIKYLTEDEMNLLSSTNEADKKNIARIILETLSKTISGSNIILEETETGQTNASLAGGSGSKIILKTKPYRWGIFPVIAYKEKEPKSTEINSWIETIVGKDIFNEIQTPETINSPYLPEKYEYALSFFVYPIKFSGVWNPGFFKWYKETLTNRTMKILEWEWWEDGNKK